MKNFANRLAEEHPTPNWRPCIGTMNLQLVRRRGQGAAGILPAVLCSDWSAGKMPAAHWGSWKDASALLPCTGTMNLGFVLLLLLILLLRSALRLRLRAGLRV